jgi:sporulation protein YlmC with PRC-barrel domain
VLTAQIFELLCAERHLLGTEIRLLFGDGLVSVDNLNGKEVISEKAFTLSEVKGAEVDTDNWKITHLHVKLADEAATELRLKKLFSSSIVCMPVNFIKAVGDVITIDKSVEELRETQEIVECKE